VDQHESTAPDPGANGIRRGDRKLNRDRGVHGVAPATENLAADFGRLGLGCRDHAALEQGSGPMDCSAGSDQAHQPGEAQGREQSAYGHHLPYFWKSRPFISSLKKLDLAFTRIELFDPESFEALPPLASGVEPQ
jgi:hypothetical protein